MERPLQMQQLLLETMDKTASSVLTLLTVAGQVLVMAVEQVDLLCHTQMVQVVEAVVVVELILEVVES